LIADHLDVNAQDVQVRTSIDLVCYFFFWVVMQNHNLSHCIFFEHMFNLISCHFVWSFGAGKLADNTLKLNSTEKKKKLQNFSYAL
jgi:hypothetical protein